MGSSSGSAAVVVAGGGFFDLENHPQHHPLGR
jgi:hypothetical protein